MKKCEFYSMMRVNHENVAKLHKGYTDGEYYYYRITPESIWCCIDGDSGMMFAYGRTLKEARADAEKKVNLLAEKKKSDFYKKAVKEFKNLKSIAKKNKRQAIEKSG